MTDQTWSSGIFSQILPYPDRYGIKHYNTCIIKLIIIHTWYNAINQVGWKIFFLNSFLTIENCKLISFKYVFRFRFFSMYNMYNTAFSVLPYFPRNIILQHYHSMNCIFIMDNNTMWVDVYQFTCISGTHVLPIKNML